MRKSLYLILLYLAICSVGYAQTYCTPTVANVANYGIGITNVTIGTINNTTTTPGTPPTYFDFTNLSASNIAGATQNVSVTLGPSNSTRVAIYIDWNNDGTFNTTYGSEYMWTNTVYTASSVQTGSFTVPTVSPGVYRMRIGSEFGGMGTPPGPCATNYGEYEDYLFVVRASSGTDALAYVLTSPASFTTGNNTIALRWFNVGATTITSASLGYQFNNGTAVTQTYSGSLAAGAGATTTFTTQLNIGSTGVFPFKAFASAPSDANLNNDTLTRTVLICNTMSGNYTIDSSQATSGTNFNKFADAVQYLTCGGITGPVNITVAKGTFNEQIVIPPIPGASATNTVTFNGGAGNASTRILKFDFPGSPTNYAVVRLSGADYVRIKNITIASTSANYGYGVLFNTSADNNIIDSCIIDLGAVTSTNSNFSAGINFSNSPTSTTGSGSNGNNNLVRGCQIKGSATGGPYRGINVYGNTSGTATSGNQFVNNSITDFFESGIYVQYYMNNMLISGNNISNPNRTSTTTFYGINIQWYNQNTVVEGNRIHTPFGGNTTTTNSFYGIFSQYNYYTGNVIRNNAIYNVNGMGTNYGIYDYYNYASPTSMPIYFNTISLDNSTAKTNTNPDYGIYVYMAINDPSYLKNIRNNIISVTRDGSSSGALRYGMYFQDAFRMVSDYNLLNVNAAVGTNVAVYQNGTNYNTIGAWRASNSNAFDQNSFSANPQFVNIVSNVTPTSCAVNNRGVAITGITTDITGATRGSVPDPGALEFNAGGANDAGISGLVNPGGIYCAGSQTVSVKLKNFGTATLTSASINWVVGGTGQTPFSWTGSLAPGAETTVNIGTYNFPASPVSFSTYTTSPNGSSDACNFNDTMVMPTVQAGLAGAYTIDPLGSGSTNFINFATAITALQQRGVCSAVTFNVAAGTYNEQVILTPVSGASAANTITFNGGTGNAATRILQFPTSSNGYGHVDLNGADFITFKNMTLKSYVGQTSGYFGVLVRNQADNNIIDSCIIDMGGLTTITTSNMGIVMSGSQFSYTASGNHGSNNIFRGNLIKGSATGGAYYGISIYPSSNGTAGTLNNKIIGNNIQDFYNYGIYTYYANSTLISGNDISRPNRTSATTTYGIYAWYDDYAVYENNSIHDPFSGSPTTTSTFYGLYLYNNSGGSGPVKAINNKLYNLNSNGSLYPIYVQYEQNMLIAHNSISMDHATSTSTSTSYGIYFYWANVAATPAVIKNNIISITRGGTGTKYAMYLQYYYFNSDNNIIHLAATNASMGYYYGYRPTAYTTLGTGTYTTLALWKAGQPGMDVNSVALNPTFTNAATGNLTPTNTSANNIGSATSVTLDINGNPRHPTSPDPGAYEWGPACTGTPTVFGVTINNGGSPVCNGSTVVLTAQYDFVSALTFQWQESTNGTSYSNITGATNFSYTTPPITSPVYYRCVITCTNSSQTATTSAVIVNTGMSGAYTINPGGSGLTNFTNFTAAINAMNTFGICGPVTFTVANGTYPGRVVIPQVLGASATNTVTFDGGSGNADNVVITEAFTTTPITSYAIVHLNGADNIRFRNMTVKTTNANYGWGFLINNAANNNIVENCTVDLSSGTSLSTALMGIVFSGSSTNYSTTGNHSNNTIVQNNYIKGSASGGAYFGISNYGSFNTSENMNVSILNNRVENFYQYGIYAYYYSLNMIIRGNTISKPNRTAATTFYGIYSVGGYNRIIDGNTITNPFGGAPTTTNSFYGIYSNNDGTNGLPITISNNLIHSSYCNGQMFGIYAASTYYASITHNTIVFDRDETNTNNTSTIYGIYSTGSTSASYPLDFKNNIIHITRSGGTRYGIYQASNPYYMASDNNNIYVNGTGSTNYFGFRGGNQATMAAWRTATGGDNNSVSIDPIFTAAWDYTPTNPSLNNLGAPSASLYQMVSMDKNGLGRKPSAPDLGCIEWTPLCVGSGITQGTPFQGTMRAGSLSDFDHLKAEDTISFQITPPTGYTNADFGATWTVDNFSFKTVNGNAPAATDTATVMPSASASGSLWFSPDNVYTDSMFVLIMNIKSLAGSQECISPLQRYVYVAPLPEPDFDTVGNCLGYALTINNTSSILRGGMSYEWNFGDTTSNNTSTDYKPSYTFSRPGVFTVTLKATSDLGYSTTAVKQIEISYEPQPNFTATAACTGDSVFFTNTTTIGGPQVPLTYTWNFADGGATSNAVSPSKLYGAIGVYNVQLNASTAGGCNKSIFKNVTVFPRPTAAFTSANACLGDNTSFTNGSTVTYGNIGNEWLFGDGTTSTDANPTKKYTTATTYTVKLRVYTEYGCRDSISKSVTVVAKPTADFATASFCDNDSTVFSNSSSANGGPALTYTWNFGDNSNSSSNASTLKHMYEDGNYTVVLNATNGSCSDSKQMQITIAEAPEASFMVNSTVCQGNATSFNNTSSNGSGTPSYSWMFGSTGTSTVKDPSYTFPSAGTFDVWLKVNSGSCSDSVKMAVTVNPNPTASFTATQTPLVNQRQMSFTPTNNTYSTYLWNFGDGNNSNQLAPVYSYLSNGPFQVTLNVTDANGCVNTSAPQTVSFNVSAGQVMSKSFSFDVYPNPFRNQATIAYNLVKGGSVEVKLFDMTGKEIAVLANAEQNEGSYELSFSAAQYNLAAGTYFVRLSLNGEVQTKQIVQVK